IGAEVVIEREQAHAREAAALRERIAETHVAVLEAGRRRCEELVGPALERVQRRERRLKRVRAVAAEHLEAQCRGGLAEAEPAFDERPALVEARRVVARIALARDAERVA